MIDTLTSYPVTVVAVILAIIGVQMLRRRNDRGGRR